MMNSLLVYSVNMSIFIAILFTIIAAPVFIYAAINLLGMVVRGFFKDSSLEKMRNDKDTHTLIRSEINKQNRAGNFITLIFIVLSLALFYGLYNYVNLWLILAILLLMFSRMPDLFQEIRTGKKFDFNNKPKGAIYTFTDVTTPLAMLGVVVSLFIFFKNLVS